MGLGALICETERGRPLGMSTARPLDWRDDLWCLELELEPDEERELWELLLDDEWREDDDDLLDDLLEEREPSVGTSRMFSSRPVVGSVVDSSLGLCETW